MVPRKSAPLRYSVTIRTNGFDQTIGTPGLISALTEARRAFRNRFPATHVTIRRRDNLRVTDGLLWEWSEVQIATGTTMWSLCDQVDEQELLDKITIDSFRV